MDTTLAELAREIEAALSLDDDLADRARAAIGRVSDDALDRADLDSTDRVLALIYSIRPGWDIAIHGTAHRPNGHWGCTLRRSAVRDNDAYIGIGRGPTLPHSLLAALLKAMAFMD